MPKQAATTDTAKAERKAIPIGYTIDARSVATVTSDISGPTVVKGRASVSPITKSDSGDGRSKKQGKELAMKTDKYIQFRPTQVVIDEDNDAVVTAGMAGRKKRVSRLENAAGVRKSESDKVSAFIGEKIVIGSIKLFFFKFYYLFNLFFIF